MHPARTAAAVVGAIVVIAGLAGCSTTAPASGPAVGTAAAIAVEAAVTTLNANAAQSNPDATLAALTGTTFFLPNASGTLVANPKFGTVTKLGGSPLRVRYTIRAGVTWSDGTPVTAADLLLQWRAAQPNATKPGTTNPVDFGAASVATALAAASSTPTISSDGRSLTVRFDRQITDWQTAFGSTVSAAGTYALAGLGTARGRAAQAAVASAITGDDRDALAALSTAWRTGYAATTMPAEAAALISDGPYVVSRIVPGQFISLTARTDYSAGPAPHVASVTVRFVPEGKAQVEALQNGQVDLMTGPATSSTVTALQGVTDTGYTTSGTASTEYLQLSPDNGGPFDAATYGSRSLRAREVRQAFLHVIPRTKIVATLFAAPAPAATVANSLTFLGGEQGASASIAANGSSAYGTVDVAAASALLQEAGASVPITVRLAVPAGDAGARTLKLIQAAAKPAGFAVVAAATGSAPDASIIAPVPNQDDASRTAALFVTGGAQNVRHYANAAVDAAYRQLQTTTNSKTRTVLLQRIDRLVWADAVSMPLYGRTDVTATADALTGVDTSPLGPTVTFWNWRHLAGATAADDDE